MSGYILVTDDSGYHKRTLAELEADFLTLADDPEAELPHCGYGVQVFGPFTTYEEGKLAAVTMPYECDYWVCPIKSDVSEARIPNSIFYEQDPSLNRDLQK